jgi:hypothetical protein
VVRGVSRTIGRASGPLGGEVIAKIDDYLARPDGWLAYVAPLKRLFDAAAVALASGVKTQ